jgi:hypothetical protein
MACMTHLDIYSTSYGKKKGWESNWQFDSQPQKSRIDLTLVHAGGVQHIFGKLSSRATILL